MTPIERIRARIARHEALLAELRDLHDEIERADRGATRAAAVRRLVANPGAVDELVARLDSDDIVDASEPPQPPKPGRGRPPKVPAGGKGGGPGASRDGHVRAVLAALGERPHAQKELCERLSIPKGSISQVMGKGAARGWWQRGAVGLSPPWELTAAGRAALAGSPT